MNINDILSDEEIEECIDGSSNITLIRSIIELTQDNNTVNEESFADIFAFEIRGFIDAEFESEVWDECNDNNWEWGRCIAENINNLVIDKWTK